MGPLDGQKRWTGPIGGSIHGDHGSVLQQFSPSWRELNLEFYRDPSGLKINRLASRCATCVPYSLHGLEAWLNVSNFNVGFHVEVEWGYPLILKSAWMWDPTSSCFNLWISVVFTHRISLVDLQWWIQYGEPLWVDLLFATTWSMDFSSVDHRRLFGSGVTFISIGFSVWNQLVLGFVHQF